VNKRRLSISVVLVPLWIVLVLSCAIAASGSLAELPSQKLALIFVGVLLLLPGVFTRYKKEYYFFLWIFIETFGPTGLKQVIPQSLKMGVYYVLDGADILLASLYFVWALEVVLERRSGRAHSKDCLWPLAGLVLACLLSVLNATDKIYAIYHTATVFKGVLVFIYVSMHAQKERMFKGILVVLMLSLASQTSLAILQEITGGNLGLKQLAINGDNSRQVLDTIGVFYRVSGTYPSGNLFSALYLDFLLPLIAAGIFVVRSWTMRITLGILLALGCISLVFTLSRGGWISFVAGGILFWFGLRLVRSKEAQSATAPLPVVALLAVVLVLTYNLTFSRLTTDDAGSAVYRIPLMQIALQMIAAHPLLGVGAGNYLETMQLYDVTSHWITRTFYAPVHNLYLYLAAESGIPALLFFLLFLFFLFRRVRKTLRFTNSFHRHIALGLVCGLSAGLLHGLFEPVSLGNYFFFWLVSGLLAALCESSQIHTQEVVCKADC
jgi:O-antigen ligase